MNKHIRNIIFSLQRTNVGLLCIILAVTSSTYVMASKSAAPKPIEKFDASRNSSNKPQSMAESAKTAALNAYKSLPNVSGKLAKIMNYNSKTGKSAKAKNSNSTQKNGLDLSNMAADGTSKAPMGQEGGWNFSTAADATGNFSSKAAISSKNAPAIITPAIFTAKRTSNNPIQTKTSERADSNHESIERLIDSRESLQQKKKILEFNINKTNQSLEGTNITKEQRDNQVENQTKLHDMTTKLTKLDNAIKEQQANSESTKSSTDKSLSLKLETKSNPIVESKPQTVEKTASIDVATTESQSIATKETQHQDLKKMTLEDLIDSHETLQQKKDIFEKNNNRKNQSLEGTNITQEQRDNQVKNQTKLHDMTTELTKLDNAIKERQTNSESTKSSSEKSLSLKPDTKSNLIVESKPQTVEKTASIDVATTESKSTVAKEAKKASIPIQTMTLEQAQHIDNTPELDVSRTKEEIKAADNLISTYNRLIVKRNALQRHFEITKDSKFTGDLIKVQDNAKKALEDAINEINSIESYPN